MLVLFDQNLGISHADLYGVITRADENKKVWNKTQLSS
jgi:hypothetical protein